MKLEKREEAFLLRKETPQIITEWRLFYRLFNTPGSRGLIPAKGANIAGGGPALKDVRVAAISVVTNKTSISCSIVTINGYKGTGEIDKNKPSGRG